MTTQNFMNRLISSGAYKPWGDPFASRFKTQVKDIYTFGGKKIKDLPLKFSFKKTQEDWYYKTATGKAIGALQTEMKRKGGATATGLRGVLTKFNAGDLNRLRSAMMGAMTIKQLNAFKAQMLK